MSVVVSDRFVAECERQVGVWLDRATEWEACGFVENSAVALRRAVRWEERARVAAAGESWWEIESSVS